MSSRVVGFGAADGCNAQQRCAAERIQLSRASAPHSPQSWPLGAVLTGGGAGYACQNDTSTEANKQASEKIAEATAMSSQRWTMPGKRLESTGQANEKIRDANRILDAERNEMRSWGQDEIYTVDDMVDAAIVKAESGTSAARGRSMSR